MASQARHESVSREETSASRFVVPRGEGEELAQRTAHGFNARVSAWGILSLQWGSGRLGITLSMRPAAALHRYPLREYSAKACASGKLVSNICAVSASI